MRKMKILLILLMVGLLTGISGCSKNQNPKTNAQIQADVLNLQPIASNLKTLISFTIDSTNLTADLFTVNGTIEFESNNGNMKVQYTLGYTHHNKIWYSNTSEIKVLSLTSDQLPTTDQALAQVKPNYEYIFDAQHFLSAPNITMDAYAGKGTTVFHYSLQGAHDVWSSTVTQTLEATYDLNSGWKWNVTEETFTETTNWAGTYHYQIWAMVEGSPTMVDEPTALVITGSITQNIDAQGVETLTNTVIAKFTLDGTDYVMPAVLNPDQQYPTSRFLRFNYGDNQAIDLSYEMGIDNYLDGTSVETAQYFGYLTGGVYAVIVREN